MKRRTLLLGAAGVGVAVAAPVAYFNDNYNGVIVKLIKRKLPDARFDDESLQAYEAEILSEYASWDKGRRMLSKYNAALTLGVEPTVFLDAETVERFERKMMTHYLLGSNYFRLHNEDVPLTYFGRHEICPNPFAITVSMS